MRLLFNKAKWQMSSDGAYLMLDADPKVARQFCEEMQEGKTYEAEIKIHRNRRSKDANAYAWVLIGKLAKKTGQSKDEIYRHYIREVGDNFEVVPIKKIAAEKWISNWETKGLGWVCEILGESKIDGYTNIVTYYGSSTYDSEQMAALINLVVQDCKEQGIETMTPAELSLLLDNWDE